MRYRIGPGSAWRRTAPLGLCLLLTVTGCASSGTRPRPTASSAPLTSRTARSAPPASSGTASSGAGTSGPSPNATESAPPGDIPDNQAFVAYTPADRAFSVRVPEGWAMTRTGTATLFSDKYNSVRVDTVTAAKAPTVASSTASELPAIKAAARGFAAGAVTTVARNAGPVLRITYRADSAPNPVTGKVVVEAVERYEFWRGGTEVVLTLSAPVGSDNVDPWRTITDSFGWKA